jgi:hypothetical protein
MFHESDTPGRSIYIHSNRGDARAYLYVSSEDATWCAGAHVRLVQFFEAHRRGVIRPSLPNYFGFWLLLALAYMVVHTLGFRDLRYAASFGAALVLLSIWYDRRVRRTGPGLIRRGAPLGFVRRYDVEITITFGLIGLLIAALGLRD